MKTLITTANLKFLQEAPGIIFLGEWCKDYNQKSKWDDKKHSVIPYHWVDREKFQKDYQYLHEFYEALLSKLCAKLNNIHKLEHSTRYWRIILGPWLLVYVATLWDRWENIRNARSIKEKLFTIIPDIDINRVIANDYNSSFKLMGQDDDWNYLLYCSILTFIKESNFTLVRKPFKPSKDINSKTSSISSKNFIYPVATIIDTLLNKIWFKRSYQFVLYKSYMPIASMAKLSFRLFQPPRLFMEFEKKLEFCNGVSNHLRENDWLDTDNDFENFVHQQILKDIPKAYLENYQSIKKVLKCGDFPLQPKIIMTASGHYFNELFKIWTAEMVEKESKLVIGSHGGAMRSKFEVFRHEEKISDCKVTWCIPFHDKHVQLSPNKVVKKNNYFGNGKNITLIGLELSRYAYRAASIPMSSLILEDFNQKVRFIKLIMTFKIPNFNFKIRPYPDKGWSLKDRYIDIFGSKVISSYKTLQEDFLNSRVIICTYPYTTFFESMQSGIPTLLLYVDKYWQLEECFAALIQQLVEVGIVHTDPESAAIHIRKIYVDPLKWWNNDETKKARLMFDEVCGAPSKDISLDKEWEGFFTKVLEESKSHNV